MRRGSTCLLLNFLLAFLAGALSSGVAQNPAAHAVITVPTFTGSFTVAGQQYPYTIVGRDPKLGGTTTIPTVLVPVSLAFDDYVGTDGKKLVIDATPDVPKVVQSPIFQEFAFATGMTQYGDAVQRAQFYKYAAARKGAEEWHTLLGQPNVTATIEIDIPRGHGYVLSSKGRAKEPAHSLAVVDLKFLQDALLKRLSNADAGKLDPEKLVIAVTKNVAFYSLEDATVCCSWGARGVRMGAASNVSSASIPAAQTFILGSYLDAGVWPRHSDVQPLTAQIAEWMNDPLHGYRTNKFPGWAQPGQSAICGGRGEGSSYLFAEPTDFENPSGGRPISNSTVMKKNGSVYHVENVALLPWYAQGAEHGSAAGTFRGAYSFPDLHALHGAARACEESQSRAKPAAKPVAETRAPNGHALIGYWESYLPAKMILPLRDVSPQWDIVIVAFASPAKGSATTGVMRFDPPEGESAEQFKSDVAYLQGKGKKVLISLGGGGAVVTLNTAEELKNFVSSVSDIVEKYGFDGVDLDIETPSLMLDADDTDFRKPTTPAIVNLIAAMHEMHDHFGPKFMIAEVPENAQAQSGAEVYSGQFGSFLPVIYGTRKILSFVDTQDYNTPPLEGLDGNYYRPGTADFHVAMTEMMLHGFPVARNPEMFFPPLPAEKVAIGLIAAPFSARNYSSVETTKRVLRYLIEGKRYSGGEYKLQQPSGYPGLLGVMYWCINEDRWNNYRQSNAIGPLLHSFPPRGTAARGAVKDDR